MINAGRPRQGEETIDLLFGSEPQRSTSFV